MEENGRERRTEVGNLHSPVVGHETIAGSEITVYHADAGEEGHPGWVSAESQRSSCLVSTEYFGWVNTESLGWVSTKYLGWVSTEYLGWVSTEYLGWVRTECFDWFADWFARST